MKMFGSFFGLLFVLSLKLNAQNLKFVSSYDDKPLRNVLVYDSQNLLVALSNENGEVDIKLLLSTEPFFSIKYNTSVNQTLFLKDIKDNTVYLDTKTIELSEILVSNKAQKPQYIVVEGYFNELLYNNKRITGYLEGIAQYVFDYKTRKYKDKRLLQYRLFNSVITNKDRKNVGSLDLNSYEMPNIKMVSNLNNLGSYTLRESVDVNVGKEIFLSKLTFQDKVFKFLGYEFTKHSEKINSCYVSNDSSIENIKFFSSYECFNLKHKSEVEFNTIQKIIKFYPTSITFIDKNELKLQKELSLNDEESKYYNEFWRFVPMYKDVKKYDPITFFGNLKEEKNTL